MKRVVRFIGWFFLWLVLFWTFLVIGFPEDTAKEWLAHRVEREVNARVSIEELRVRWNLSVEFRGITVESRPEGQLNAFKLNLGMLKVKSRLLSLLRLRPVVDFEGDTPSGGDFSGSYDPRGLSISFGKISFRDLSIAALPLPSAATASGSGDFRFVKGQGSIEVEVDGVPGGRQRLKAPGGEGPGLDGKVKVRITLPKI